MFKFKNDGYSHNVIAIPLQSPPPYFKPPLAGREHVPLSPLSAALHQHRQPPLRTERAQSSPSLPNYKWVH